MTQKLVTSAPAQVRAVSGRPETAATLMEVWQGLSAAVVDTIADNWHATEQTYRTGRMEHYFSAEFLMGRALLNNLTNLGLVKEAEEAVGAFG
ncbi:MAG: glycogen phosphorylase, partial [Actinomyces sp.]